MAVTKEWIAPVYGWHDVWIPDQYGDIVHPASQVWVPESSQIVPAHTEWIPGYWIPESGHEEPLLCHVSDWRYELICSNCVWVEGSCSWQWNDEMGQDEWVCTPGHWEDYWDWADHSYDYDCGQTQWVIDTPAHYVDGYYANIPDQTIIIGAHWEDVPAWTEYNVLVTPGHYESQQYEVSPGHYRTTVAVKVTNTSYQGAMAVPYNFIVNIAGQVFNLPLGAGGSQWVTAVFEDNHTGTVTLNVPSNTLTF